MYRVQMYNSSSVASLFPVGWYEGERLRDLQWGWFPSNFTTEIENEHTRARNLKETHRLLSLPCSPEEYAAKITTIR